MSYEAPVISSVGCWVPATDTTIPAGAFAGGHDGRNPVYVIRGYHNGAWLPGKFVVGHRDAYVPWGGKEITCCQFEVLCHARMRWQSCYGGNVPPNAFVGGSSETGERLYIGRVMHGGRDVCIGKVQRSHNVCYYSYGGKEISASQYEILVV